jgi:thioredoxin 1
MWELPQYGLAQRNPLVSRLITMFTRRLDVSNELTYLSDDSFEDEVLKSEQPVLVDYWAEWCGPCKMIAPILEEIASEYTGRIKVAKINIDENPGTPPKYGIRGIPTLMLFKNGEVEATKVGALSKSQLAAFLDQNI